MKRTILIMSILLAGCFCSLLPQNVYSTSVDTKPQVYGIKDGWYSATVQYTNYSTGTNATYTLKVYVQYNNVIKIDFGNGGSVHSGYNNEGYIYSGGTIYFETDIDGNIIAGTSTVSTSDSNGIRYFKIRIE
jgi:hypothetical protein